jgi:DNA-binding transcriptional regulator LsrR (DeoR family)
MNFGTIKTTQFQQAINKVIHAMTPQEQKNVAWYRLMGGIVHEEQR